MVGGWGVEGVFEDHISTGKTRIHVTFADFNVLEQVAFLMDLRHTILACLNRVGNYRLQVKLRFDQPGCLVGDLLGFRGDNGKRITHIANTLPNTHHDRPVIDDQPVIVFAGDVIRG